MLGYEWDEDVDNGFRPDGLVQLSTTTANVSAYLQDYGSTYAPGTATHHMTLYRAPSGALVFGAGTIQYSWGLDSFHDGQASTPDVALQQATINLFADMGVQPTTLMHGLVAAVMSTDYAAPVSTITSPTEGMTISAGTSYTIRGTAQDLGGGKVGAVEVSVDGGTTWHPAVGRESWTYTWTPRSNGPVNDSHAGHRRQRQYRSARPWCQHQPLNRTRACTRSGIPAPRQLASTAATARPSKSACVSASTIPASSPACSFYKAAANSGTHTGHLWDSNGNLLASATFTNETASGWQTVEFSSPVAVVAGMTYVASYTAPKGHYSVSRNYFTTLGVDNGPLHAVSQGAAGNNGLYSYSPGSLPTQSYQASNYWVDVVYNTALAADIDRADRHQVWPGRQWLGGVHEFAVHSHLQRSD